MVCFNCSKETINSYPICDRCKPLKIDRDSSCVICGYPQTVFVKKCRNCLDNRVINRSLFLYTGLAKDILRLYKFSKRYSFARYFSELIINEVEEDLIICPVPTSSIKKRINSGYHLDPIIKTLKKSKKVKIVNLLKKRYSHTQKQLARKERFNNLNNSFCVINIKYANSKILLFDDVYTTGATLESCYDVLIKAGYKHIQALTLYHD